MGRAASLWPQTLVTDISGDSEISLASSAPLTRDIELFLRIR